MLKEQKLYFLFAKHRDTTFSAFMWWIKRRNKKCKRFCPTCEYYFRCQEDVALEELMNGKTG